MVGQVADIVMIVGLDYAQSLHGVCDLPLMFKGGHSCNPEGSRMNFEIIGAIRQSDTFAVGYSIRALTRLRKVYGEGRWRKRKGIATVRLSDGTIRIAELHWYEA